MTEYGTWDHVLLVRQIWPLSTAPPIRFTVEPIMWANRRKGRFADDRPWRFRAWRRCFVWGSFWIRFSVWISAVLLESFRGFRRSRQTLCDGVWESFLIVVVHLLILNLTERENTWVLQFDSYPGRIPQPPCLFVVWSYNFCAVH